jgi:hypothetical protein
MDRPIIDSDAEDVIDYVAEMTRQLASLCRRDFHDVAALLAVSADRAEQYKREIRRRR